MTLDDNIIIFVSNIRVVFLKKLHLLRVFFPCHTTNEYCASGIVLALAVMVIKCKARCQEEKIETISIPFSSHIL